jgi:tRNA (guanine37-N1)-methyltransferase
MRCDILTLFPRAVEPYLTVGVLGRAAVAGVLEVRVHDLRHWAINRYGQVDDQAYGGGPGMVLMAPVVVPAVREVAAMAGPPHVVLPDPRGRRFDDGVARELAGCDRLLVVCGRYEGFDERVHEILRADEISLGDFVLSGGELAALTILDAAARHLPVFSRPREFEGLEVPEVLVSGNHEAVRRWRLEAAVRLTLRRRPDLVRAGWAAFSAETRALIAEVAAEEGISLAPVAGEIEEDPSRRG